MRAGFSFPPFTWLYLARLNESHCSRLGGGGAPFKERVLQARRLWGAGGEGRGASSKALSIQYYRKRRNTQQLQPPFEKRYIILTSLSITQCQADYRSNVFCKHAISWPHPCSYVPAFKVSLSEVDFFFFLLSCFFYHKTFYIKKVDFKSMISKERKLHLAKDRKTQGVLNSI